jgi:hypothetical protein
MEKFKYTAKFKSVVNASSVFEDMNISTASLEPLKELIPDSIDLERNIDLVGVAFNAAVVNKFNQNGDGIDTSSAMAIKDYFIHKPTNIEHQKDNIVGHIVSAEFSEHKEGGEILEEVDASSSEPFNISLGAVVYRTASPEFADVLLASSDPESESYNSVSASWEIGFNEYAVAVGNGNVGDSEVVTDPDEVEALTPYLKSFGGTGELKDGKKVNRLIVGEIYPLGIGFTNTPAADVTGVLVKESLAEEEEKVDDQRVREHYIDKEKSSHLESTNVIQSDQEFFLNTMEKQELLKDIEQLLCEKAAAKDFSDEAIANITKVFHDAIREKSQEYVDQIEQAKADQAEALTQKDELAITLSELQEKLTETETKLGGLEEEKVEREARARFDSRMELIEELYELDNEDKKIVASEVSSLDLADEAFAEYQERLTVLFKTKNKEYLQKLADEMEAKIEAEVTKRLESKATVEETVEEQAVEEASADVEQSLDQATAEDAGLPNNNGESIETEETLRERFAKAFRDSVKVTY